MFVLDFKSIFNPDLISDTVKLLLLFSVVVDAIVAVEFPDDEEEDPGVVGFENNYKITVISSFHLLSMFRVIMRTMPCCATKSHF